MFKVKHFLGLANYFRDHVPNVLVQTISLQKLVVGYTKSIRNRKMKLEGAALATFLRLRDLIDRSQKLFYLDIEEGDQIHLKTNASDYGMEAYLYEEGGGDNHSLFKSFFSESSASYVLFANVFRWRMFMQEFSYAIVRVVKTTSLPTVYRVYAVTTCITAKASKL
jgi:hypothetical protein